MHIKEYKVFASEKPSAANPVPQVFVNTVFAKNEIIARSKTFGLLRKQYKIKLTKGVVLKIEEVPQHADNKVRTFGVRAAYIIKRKTVNVLKEIRALTRAEAVFGLLQDLRTRHSVRPETVGIVEVTEIDSKDVTSKELLQIVGEPRYPLFDKRVPSTAPKCAVVALNRA
ncbi:large subunit ribosomal protein L18Ae [Nematocida major]|uniref:large subunit ribosomal protein L18Ae n=1 Tax=Nematocida major TaxID=1912982 RepID=UPI0020085624|nr:large subunit ribosomal protein L18Ae [Nematocida major]KAH9385658.1 large subunit ribosomal protein L18Ae [Nematocida major]